MNLEDFGVPPTFLGHIFRILGLLRFWGEFGGFLGYFGDLGKFGGFWGFFSAFLG